MGEFPKIDQYLALIKTYPHIVANENTNLTIVTDEEILYREQARLYAKAAEKSLPKVWYDLGVVAQDAWILLLRDLVIFPNGTYGPYVRRINRRSQLEMSGKDVVILVRLDGKLLLFHHFRHDDRAWHWECPRGYGEAGLTPEQNAEKEIYEETGLYISRLIRLDNDMEPTAWFLADCKGNINNFDQYESISNFILLDDTTFRQKIAECDIDDAYTLRAFLMADIKHLL